MRDADMVSKRPVTYIIFDDFPLETFGKRIPNVSVIVDRRWRKRLWRWIIRLWTPNYAEEDTEEGDEK